MATTSKIKRLYFDIETSPCVGYFWRPGYNVSIPYQNIIQESKIICISYKWGHEDEVHSLTWNKKQDDKSMLKKFVKVAHKADEIVAHNGDRFDLKWIKTRCLKHGIETIPRYYTLDTLKAARGHFNFNSNRLDYIAKFLDVGGKIETGGFDLWAEVMNGDKDALDKMVAYCENDVIILQKVFERLKNYVPHKTHSRVNTDNERFSCPECGSNDVHCNQTRTTAMGTIKRLLRCKSCRKMYTVSNKVFMDLLQWRMKSS